MHVIGTAGHVDHGKSTLVRALTGIDPDRLQEEKKRQMTIDLGFAWYDSPTAGSIGIVDVPGHRDFVANMLAGVGGMEAVLLVIAADEGVMPQTREHLAILNLLRINIGLVALTKIDLIDDTDWLDLVEGEINSVLKGSTLEHSKIVRVSSLTGEGIAALKQEIDHLLFDLGPQSDFQRPRLPVDRVFTMQGFGTVVTGTLVGGSLIIDDDIEILPGKIPARIRGMQTHKRKETSASPGSRTAINISGVDHNKVHRGDVLTRAGLFTPTRLIDAAIDLLPDSTADLRHNDKVKIHAGTAECIGRMRLIQIPAVSAGEKGYSQIEFDKEMIMDIDDRFIIRRMSPAQTIGGGTVLNPHPSGYHRLKDSAIFERFITLESRNPIDQVLSMVLEHPFISIDELTEKQKVRLDPAKVMDCLKEAIEAGKLVRISCDTEPDVLLSPDDWHKYSQKMQEVVKRFHEQNPLRPGIRMEELGSRTNIPAAVLHHCVSTWIQEGYLKQKNGVLTLKEFQIQLSPNQKRRFSEYLNLVEKDPFNPPSGKIARELLGDELFQSLVAQDYLVQFSPEVVFRENEYQVMLDFVKAECRSGKLLTLAQFRDHFLTSRKYAQAILEYLDRKKVTIREGEGRKLRV